MTVIEIVPGESVPGRFAGSPTVLVDGANLFGGEGVDTLACALHPPTADQVEAALPAAH